MSNNNKNYKFFSNKYKFILLNNINKNSKILIYIRYNHLQKKPINDLKKSLSKKSVFKMFKKNILKINNKSLKKKIGYGSICLISTDFLELTKILEKIKKQKNFELLFVETETGFYSKLKILDITNLPNPYFQIKKPLYFLNNILKNISKADIT